MEDLSKRIANMIITRCRLKDISPDTCDYDAPLFYNEDDESEGGFELDSVDALELVAGIKEEFGITMESKDMGVFYSINTLTKYLEAKIKGEVVV